MQPFYLLIILLLMPGLVFAEKTYIYNVFTESQHENIGTFNRTYAHLPGDLITCKIVWNNRYSNSGNVQYMMNARYATQSVHFQVPKENTNYICTRNKNQLLIKGQLKGIPITKSVTIDQHPFYFNPSIGLQQLASKGKGSQTFWVLRPDDLSPFKMIATVSCQETLQLQNTSVPVIKIKWHLTGLLSLFFTQTGWFRQQDGIFIKSSTFDDEYFLLFSQTEQILP